MNRATVKCTFVPILHGGPTLNSNLTFDWPTAHRWIIYRRLSRPICRHEPLDLSRVHTSNASNRQLVGVVFNLQHSTVDSCILVLSSRSTCRRNLNMFNFFRSVAKTNGKNRSTCRLRRFASTRCWCERRFTRRT